MLGDLAGDRCGLRVDLLVSASSSVWHELMKVGTSFCMPLLKSAGMHGVRRSASICYCCRPATSLCLLSTIRGHAAGGWGQTCEHQLLNGPIYVLVDCTKSYSSTMEVTF